MTQVGTDEFCFLCFSSLIFTPDVFLLNHAHRILNSFFGCWTLARNCLTSSSVMALLIFPSDANLMILSSIIAAVSGLTILMLVSLCLASDVKITLKTLSLANCFSFSASAEAALCAGPSDKINHLQISGKFRLFLCQT